jgi:nucleotide-binding universal stress UspA family protein
MSYDVVVGVDTSEASGRAVRLACQLQSTELVGPVLLVHVVPWSPFSFATPEENERRHIERQKEIRAAESQVLDPMRRIADTSGCRADTTVRHGDPVEVLEDIAREESARLLIVGRTGDTGLRQRLFGGLPAHLVQSAPIPVVVVP